MKRGVSRDARAGWRPVSGRVQVGTAGGAVASGIWKLAGAGAVGDGWEFCGELSAQQGILQWQDGRTWHSGQVAGPRPCTTCAQASTNPKIKASAAFIAATLAEAGLFANRFLADP